VTLAIFWASILLILYIFILFPALVMLRGMLIWRPYRTADITPSLSMVIAAYNEAGTIRAKLENILSLDYPPGLLEVIIASDGSTDGTDEIVESYSKRGIKLLSLPRTGKNAALTQAAMAASGEILVFSDANSMYTPAALRALVRPFADPQVGGVAGNQVYKFDKRNASGSAGERGYWDFDRYLKHFQDRSGNITSATGSIYAIRRSLFQPIALGLVDDFMASTGVILQGYRLVFAGEAISYEGVAESKKLEFSRKVRITLQGLNSVLLRAELLNPFRYGFYAVQLFSHKLLRRLIVLPLIALLVTSPLLWANGLFYQFMTIAQFGFYSLAMIGFIFEGKALGKIKIFSIPFYFTLIYAAALFAVIKLLRGQQIKQWETPVREDVFQPAPDMEGGLSQPQTHAQISEQSAPSGAQNRGLK
jgi:cellulose synthase/poly-beta-1,6-N-acetylglucosamine synthase-like glycosyltransferase